jgi:hypothetical protein
MRTAAITIAFALACSSTPPPAQNDAGADAPVVSVPTNTSLAIDGDPNGLYWDDAASTLYVADDGNNRVLMYTDSGGLVKFADLPAAPASGPGLGQLIPLGDGSLLVTRFGYGTTGDVVQVMPDATSTIIPNLDPTKRRIGLARADDGTIFDTYFEKNGTGYVGAVASLTLAGVETDVVTGLQKPVGVLVIGPTFYADDQDTNELYTTPTASPGTLTELAQLPDADLLCVGPNGSIFSGGADGNVRQIDASANVTVFATGFAGARGVAYDPTNKRLFIANHVGASGPNTIEVRPVP